MLFVYDPSATRLYPRCVFHSVTGWQCPGCGTTRALHQLLHGHVREAFRFNAMLFVLGPFLILAGGAELRRIVGNAPRTQGLQQPWVGWAAAALVIGWGVVRNLW